MNAPVDADPWAPLRRHTPARIALGRSGTSLPTHELLRFAAAHARARDAVHVPLDVPALLAGLQAEGQPVMCVHSRAQSRQDYLRRPDHGRALDEPSRQMLCELPRARVDLAVVIGDGLSALAVQSHAAAVLQSLRRALAPRAGEPPLAWGPTVVATQARVALADEIGAALGARLVLILLGERPGLSAADSLGAYLTHAPRVGRTDAERNCVSNIRGEGLPPEAAGRRLAWLVRESLRLGLSGIGLKDHSAIDKLSS
ncbi:MAG: ethanolamine ammonia-lyase subunit EutC [Burkholderiaceae bacterium]|nr:ethanolamine ammonia-lyase subunit EutC [Burkholderiaceae bacterium]